ncbi:MAG: hypothetical protein ACJ8MH_04285, partial [Povalibacter sp.]
LHRRSSGKWCRARRRESGTPLMTGVLQSDGSSDSAPQLQSRCNAQQGPKDPCTGYARFGAPGVGVPGIKGTQT